MKVLLPVFLFFYLNCNAQKIEHRLILFGDAGEINMGQKLVIQKANELVIPNKTSVYYLGDNIYPLGMGLDSSNIIKTGKILESQYREFIQKNVPVTFVAGNHDWDKSGKNGLKKIVAQEAYIENQQSKNLFFSPKAGTANTHVITVNDVTKLLIYDSEYWLFPHHSNPDSALSSTIRNNFLSNLKSILDENKDHTIFILSHHPMRTYGEHGENISWRDHIFPLTRKWKNMYLPLPVFGSLYPLIRTTIFNSAEDTRHPVYKRLIQDVTTIADKHKSVVFVAGHDHGLQYIVDENFTQIVTGSGAKKSHIAKHHTQKFASNRQGFCIVDCLDNKTYHVTFYNVEADVVNKSFETSISKR